LAFLGPWNPFAMETEFGEWAAKALQNEGLWEKLDEI
jgi:hypothetical protein